jgi:hypothetical protein
VNNVSSEEARICFYKELYAMLRDGWCDIALNVHSSAEDKTNDLKDNFYEKLKRIRDQFSN